MITCAIQNMCGGDNGAAAAAEAQRQMMEAQQKKHDDAVTAGKKSIDDSFAQFDDPYFDKYQHSYVDVYNPQLDDQYKIAKDKLTSALAGKGQLEGSAGASALSRLDKTYNDTRADIGNRSVDATNAFRSSVDNTKGNLYTQNSATADPLTMAAQAQAQSGAIVAPQSYPTLGDVFSGALAPYATATKVNNQSMNPNPNFNPVNWFAPVGGQGSAVFG